MDNKSLKLLENKNITYHDIKKATNLGIGTISRFFNNGSISDSAKLKIEKFIKEYNYMPNIGAKLIKGYEDCIYLIACSINENSIQNILNSVIEQFKKINLNVYVVIASYDPQQYLEVLKKTIIRKPKNLILFTPPLNDELKNFIDNIKINTWIYGDDFTNKISTYFDETQMVYELVNKIKNANYQKIIYFGKDVLDINTGKKRYMGYKNAIKNTNIQTYEFFSTTNEIEDIKKQFIKIIPLIENNTILICTTHTIFKYCYFQKINNNFLYDLTDIGYKSMYDLFDAYKYKIYIDYYEIGKKLFYLYEQKENTNLKLTGKIIEK